MFPSVKGICHCYLKEGESNLRINCTGLNKRLTYSVSHLHFESANGNMRQLGVVYSGQQFGEHDFPRICEQLE